MKRLDPIYTTSNWLLYLLLFVLTVLLQYTDLEFVTTEKVYQAYREQQQIEEYGESYADEFSEDLEQMGYDDENITDILIDLAIDSVFVLVETIKLPYIALFLLIGFEVFQNLKRVNFSDMLKAAIVADFVFLIQSGIHQLYLVLFLPDRTMDDIAFSKPLSLKSLLGGEVNYDGFLGYVIGYFDLFELLYIIMLSVGVAYTCQKKLNEVLGQVILYYLLSQLLAILFTLFLFEILLA